MYTYRIDARTNYLRVEVAIHDPERWKASALRDPDEWAGRSVAGQKFGFDAEVVVHEDLYAPRDERSLKVEVSMGAIGSHSVAEGRQRVDVYEQACNIGAFIENVLEEARNSLSSAEPLPEIAEFLKTNLATDIDEPTAERFTYSG